MANNTPSLNVLKDIFYSLAMNNRMVMDFDFGATWNINSNQRKYPLVFVEPSQTTAVKSDIGQGRIQMYVYSFNIYVMDRISKGDKNYDEILSDCQLILQSFVAQMDQHQSWTDWGFNIDGNVTWQPVFEIEDDNLNGWMATISIRVPNRLTPCNTPQIVPLSWTYSLNEATYQVRLIGPQGPTGAAGATGLDGIDASNVLDWVYTTTQPPDLTYFTSDNLRVDLLTRLFISTSDLNNNDRTTWLDQLKNYISINPLGSIIQLTDKTTSDVVGVYFVSLVTQPAVEYFNLTLTPINTLFDVKLEEDRTYGISWVLNGAIGPKGQTGSAGPIGPQGDPGPVAPAGLNWRGLWSSSTTYVLNDTVSWNGASWWVYNGPVGPSINPPEIDTSYWALLASQGAPGPIGPQGNQGATGAQGFQGNQGPIGPQGFQGEQGSQGFQGNQGSVGPQGFQGFQGSVGPQGFQGEQGPQGFQGFQGATGPQGTVNLTTDSTLTIIGSTISLNTGNRNAWTASQYAPPSALTNSATITIDMSLGNNFYITLTNSTTTMAVPTNIQAGQSGIINLYQNVNGTRLVSWAWVFQFLNGTAPTLTTASWSKDSLPYYVDKNQTYGGATVSVGSPCVVTTGTNTLSGGDIIQFSTGSLPTGLSFSTIYFVRPVTSNTFNLSLTQQGSNINTTGTTGSATFSNTSILITSLLNVR